MPVQINKEDYAKPWRPGIYPKSTTVIYNNQLWILNDAITGLFSSSDFMAEVANGDWVGRYTTEDELPTKTSNLINDGSDSTSTYVETDELGATAFSNDYNDLDNLPIIPTPISNHSTLTLDDGTNPHETTKGDVGLGNVPNIDTSTTSNISEGSNLYFTTARVLATVLSGLSLATGGAIVSTDSILVAFGKIQKQIDDLTTSIGNKLDKVSTTGVERAYIINADGSQGTKATNDFKDVLEFANLAAFPVTGETGKIYLTLDTNKTYRWSGSAYIQIGNVPEVEQQLQRYWYSVMANTLNTTLLQVNNTNVFTVAGTPSVVSRAGTNYYNSIAMNNYLSATANGSNCGIKNNNQGDGSYLEGFDSSFVFINNNTNVNCETTVGYYGLLSAIPNIPKSTYNTDFVGVGNDVGDVNLSFYCKRNTETPSYTKVDCGSSFPAHTTTDAYILRMQMSRGFNGSGRTLKMTITNIITGAVFSHIFTDSQIPASSRNIAMVVNRSNRNTGVATNIRFSKWHQTKYIY